jgi:hypothetical protein
MTFVDDFGNKSAGELIRAELWNNLMSALDALSATVDTRFATVDDSLATLGTRVTTLEGTVGTLQTDVGALQSTLAEYYKVSLSTTRASYATGEQATIVARLTDLRGNPLTFAADARPWIDFVTVGGHLRPADGFESQGGDSSGGEHGIAVRTNASGEAHVLLYADVGKDLPVETHADVSAFMTSKLADARTISQAILEAPTPSDAKQAGAFTSIAAEYDRSAAKNMRAYVDAYYVHRAPSVIGKIAPPIVSPRWRDYGSIVVAAARADSDPTTPDQARGGGSIRVAFRDWVAPWLLLHYLHPEVLAPKIGDFRVKFQPHFTADYFDSVGRLRAEIGTSIDPTGGLVGRIRDLQAAHGALDGVSVSQPADVVDKVRATVQTAIVFQQSMEPVQAATFSARDGTIAVNALTDSATNGAADVRMLKSQVGGLQSKVDRASNNVAAAQQRLSTLDGRVSETSSHVAAVSASVSTVHEQVSQVAAIYGGNTKEQFTQLLGTVARVTNIEQKLGLIK